MWIEDQLDTIRNLYMIANKYGKASQTLNRELHSIAQDIIDQLFLPQQLRPEEVMVGEVSGKISCIRDYRARIGCSLIEAKQAVEKYFADHNLSFDSKRDNRLD